MFFEHCVERLAPPATRHIRSSKSLKELVGYRGRYLRREDAGH